MLPGLDAWLWMPGSVHRHLSIIQTFTLGLGPLGLLLGRGH
jgi:hypothetical protein